jgi:two-component system invasion response regulator UvrY
MAVAGEAATGQQTLDAVSRCPADVLLLDISMPGQSVFDVLKSLTAAEKRPAILILTMHPEEQYAVRVLKAGASGYLTKESAPDELITAIRKVASGGRYISTKLAETLAFHLYRSEQRPLHEILSDREYQVMLLIASGRAVTQIAQTLSLSVKTVSTYRRRVLEKMGLKNNMEIMQYAFRHQLVEK